MDWMLVITMLFDFLAECMKNRSRDDIEAGIRDPGMAETFALRYILRKKFGLRGKELRKAVHGGIAYGKSMPQRVMVDLLDEAEERVQAAAAADHS